MNSIWDLKTVVDLVEKLTAFQNNNNNKKSPFSSDVSDKMLHFPTMKNLIKSSTQASVTKVMSDF